MVNKRLKNHVLETVEKQLQMNEPKCTKETLEQLVLSGIEVKRAKEMIAAVLLEEIYYILKHKEPFNEQRYAQKLSDLDESLPMDTGREYKDFTNDMATRYNSRNVLSWSFSFAECGLKPSFMQQKYGQILQAYKYPMILHLHGK